MHKPKLSGIEVALAILMAIVVDIIDFIPILDVIVSLGSFIIFWLWFTMRGVRQGWNIACQAVDVIPILDIIPATTLGILITVIIDRVPAKAGRVAARMATAGLLKNPETREAAKETYQLVRKTVEEGITKE